MATDRYGIEVDDGYPIRVFHDEIASTNWEEMVGFPEPFFDRRRDDLITRTLTTPEGKKCFSDFLKTIDNAPSLKGLKEEADEDVRLLLINGGHLDGFITDISGIAFYVDDSPEKEAARKTLEGLANKGYPQAQIFFGQILAREGKTDRASVMFMYAENNQYADEGQSDEATRLRMECTGKKLERIVSERSGQSKEPSFLEIANSAKNLDDVSDENLSAEMAAVGKQIVDRFFDKPVSEYKPEDVKALEILSEKKDPLAQQYLVSYYSEKGQYSKAFSMADNLRRNPYAADHEAEHAKKMADALLPLARKEQASRNTGGR